jgi:hypothetical protein
MTGEGKAVRPPRRLDPTDVDAEYRSHGLEPISPYVRAGDERECICIRCGTLRRVPLRTLRDPNSAACRWCWGWKKWKPWGNMARTTAAGWREIRGAEYSSQMLALERLVPLTTVGDEFTAVGVMCTLCYETLVTVPERIHPKQPGWFGCQGCSTASTRTARSEAEDVYLNAGLKLLVALRGQHTKYPAECLKCGTRRFVSYHAIVTSSAPACWVCTHGILPDEPHRVYLFRFPALGVLKVGITHNRHDARLIEHQVNGGVLVETVLAPNRDASLVVEAWVLANMAKWRSPEVGPADFPQGGWTEAWIEEGAPVVRLAAVCDAMGVGLL